MAEDERTIHAYLIKCAWLSGRAQYIFPELVGGANPIDCAARNCMCCSRKQRGANEFTPSKSLHQRATEFLFNAKPRNGRKIKM